MVTYVVALAETFVFSALESMRANRKILSFSAFWLSRIFITIFFSVSPGKKSIYPSAPSAVKRYSYTFSKTSFVSSAATVSSVANVSILRYAA